jgi:hypothetical protein
MIVSLPRVSGRQKLPRRPMKSSMPKHNGSGLSPCTSPCRGCEAEEALIQSLGPPPLPDQREVSPEHVRGRETRRDRYLRQRALQICNRCLGKSRKNMALCQACADIASVEEAARRSRSEAPSL